MMDLVIAPTALPLRWQGVDYRVVKAGIKSGSPYAEVSPKNGELEAAIIRGLQTNQALKILWKHGYFELFD